MPAGTAHDGMNHLMQERRAYLPIGAMARDIYGEHMILEVSFSQCLVE